LQIDGRIEPLDLQRTAWAPVLAITAGGALVHAVVMARYGFHRDEFYYIQSGRHLAWGYVDQPPLTPIMARLAAALPGSDLLALRTLSILCAAACAVLIALLARELGGGRRAQVIAAAIAVVAPAFLGTSFLFGTTIVDLVASAAVYLLVTRALRTDRLTAWVGAGVAAGVGLENKRTVGVLLIGIFVGLAVTRREVLRTPGPWVAAGIAAVLFAPNLIWDAVNDWPTFAMTQRLADKIGGPLGELGQLALLPLVLGVLVLPFVFIGVRWLLRDPAGRRHRWTVVTAVVVLVVFAVGLGKVYYPVPAFIPFFAAGAVVAEAQWKLRRTAVLLTASFVTTVPLALPFVSASTASTLPALKDVAIESYGWPEFADQVVAAVRALPATDQPGLVIFTGNYGEAGALQQYGPARGLTAPIRSGHNGYGDWGPELSGTPQTVLCVGDFPNAGAYLHRGWRDVTPLARIRYPSDVSNEEIRFHTTIYACRQPVGSWAQIWPRLRHLDGHLRSPRR
jgi:hypothetical protein